MKLPVKYDALMPAARRAVRLQYEKDQGGMCYYCKCPLGGKPHANVMDAPVYDALFPPGFFNHPIHLHHSHKTGLTIGAVHARCNAVLWQYHRE